MTARQFEKRIAPVLEKYGKYNMTAHKVWKEKDQIFFSVKLGPDAFRKARLYVHQNPDEADRRGLFRQSSFEIPQKDFKSGLALTTGQN